MIAHLIYGFDDPHIQQDIAVQQTLRQLAPRALDGGREVVWSCPLCEKPWYAAGRSGAQTRLSPEQLVRLTGRLQADRHAGARLPTRLCPSCAARTLGGRGGIEAYHYDLGYRLTWQRAAAPVVQFVCCIHRRSDQVCPDLVAEVLAAPTDLPLSSPASLWQSLEWIATLAEPPEEEVFALAPQHRGQLAAFLPPARDFAWRGYAWRTQCAALGPALVVQGVTFPESCTCRFVLACWRQIARTMQMASLLGSGIPE